MAMTLLPLPDRGRERSSHSLPKEQAGEFDTSSPRPPLLPQPKGGQEGGSAGPSPSCPLQQEAFPCRAAAEQTLCLPLREGAQELLPSHRVPIPASSRGLLLPPPGSTQLLPGQQWEAEVGATSSPARSQLGAASHPGPSPASPLWSGPRQDSSRHHTSPRTLVVPPDTTTASLRGQTPFQPVLAQRQCWRRAVPHIPTPLHWGVTPSSLQQGWGETPAPSPPSPNTHWQRRPDEKCLRSPTRSRSPKNAAGTRASPRAAQAPAMGRAAHSSPEPQSFKLL